MPSAALNDTRGCRTKGSQARQRFWRWVVHIDEQGRERDHVFCAAPFPAPELRTPQPDRDKSTPTRLVGRIEAFYSVIDCRRITEWNVSGGARVIAIRMNGGERETGSLPEGVAMRQQTA